MARIAGVDIPREKRLEISLTYIFGIGRTHAAADLRATRIVARHPGPRPHRRRGRAAPHLRSTRNLKVEGDLRREVAAGHQAQDGDRLLPGHPPPPGPAGPRPAHPHQRPHPQGPEEDRRRQEEGPEVTDGKDQHGQAGGRRSSPASASARTSPTGSAHIKSSFNNTIVSITDQRGQRARLGLGRQRRLQGLPQVHAVRRPAGGRDRAPAGPWSTACARSTCVVKGPGSGRETAIRSHPEHRHRGHRHQGRHARPAQRLPPAQAAEGLSHGSLHRTRSAGSAAASG